jgi:hypothetical protein
MNQQQNPRLIDYVTEWLHHQPEPVGSTLSDYEQVKRQLKPADVILIEGTSRVDATMRQVTGCQWTHAMLFIGKPMDIPDADVRTSIITWAGETPDVPLILHSTLDKGPHLLPLAAIERFNLRVVRPRSLGARDGQQVVRYAVSRLGPRPRFMQWLDLMRFMLPWSLVPARWRNALFRYHPGRHARAGTSSLIADAFSFIQYPILPLVKISNDKGTQLFRRNLRICLPSDIEQSPYFDIVKIPHLDFSHYKPSDLLPWKGSGVLTTDEATRAISRDDKPRGENILPMRFKENEE